MRPILAALDSTLYVGAPAGRYVLHTAARQNKAMNHGHWIFARACLISAAADRHGDDPQGAGQLHRRAHGQGDGSVFCGRAYHRTGVMNRERGPEAELGLAEMQRGADGWEKSAARPN